MKKILFLTAGICLAVGIGLALTAVILGGDTLFRQGIYTNTPTEKTFTVTESFTSLSIEDVEGDITILPSSDGTCRVDTVTVANTDYEIAVKDGTLTVRFTDARRFLDRVGILAGMKVTVYLPAQCDTVTVTAISGDVSFDGTADTLNVGTTSGDVSIKADANALTVSAISGDITLQNTTADTLDVRTTSGDIRLRSCDANDLSLHAVSGDITGSLRTPKNFSAHATSGDVSVPASDTSAGACRAETTSGDVKLTVENG